MIRKTLCFISMVMVAMTALAVVGSDWYKYPIYCDNIDDVVETSNKVFYLSGGNMYSFSPEDNESYGYSHLNKLNDQDIQSLYYNSEKKYLVVVYTNSNIDVILDNGQVINMPDIKDSSVSWSKHINDVAFGADRIAVATDFGFVLYNDDKFEVIESGIYNKSIKAIGIMGGNLIIYGHTDTNYQLKFSPLDTRHNTLDKFTVLFGFGTASFRVLSDDVLALQENLSNKIVIRKVDFTNSTYKNIENGIHVADSPIKKSKDNYYLYSQDKIYILDVDGSKEVSVPEALHGQKFAFYDDPQTLWAGDPYGVARYDISASTPTVLYDKMLYDGFITDQRVGYMRWSPDYKRLYISNMEASETRQYAQGEGSQNYQTTNIITENDIIDASVKKASASHLYSTKYQNKFNSTRMFGDPQSVVEDPDDPQKYYIANYFEGVYVVKLNPETGEYEEIGKFDASNSTLVDNWGPRAMFLDFDREGNLWVGHQFGNNFSVLPAAKRRQDPSTITAADWKAHPKLEALGISAKDFMGVVCKKSNMVFYSMSRYNSGFIAIDTKGTYTDLSDDVVYHWPRFTDQDGKELNYNYITFFIEDNRGCVWVGTTQGIFEITDPSKATNHEMRVRRIKVPRNDGTNYADYLLESDVILWIALDPSGRKWVATEGSGIYLVSESGDKIIYHFDSTNSPLSNNLVCSVECDHRDNTVYVGTNYGLFSFKGDSSPGQEDFSEVYAYPNPVRPEYSGIVTITGLMDNSVVKITDSMGTVVYQTRSEGGMACWDACQPSGERVRSGVYYVYASQYDGTTSNGAVTKILVIN